jgi:Ca-activated chloride channel family protein
MQVDVALEYDTFPLGQPIRLYVMMLMKGDAAPNQNKRRPLNLSLVVDRSGSMAGAKIDYTRRAATMLVQNLGLNDTLSVVLYNDEVTTLLPPEKVQRKDIINQQIQRIAPSGATNLSGGWLEGVKWVLQNHRSDQTNRIILISDGLANRGVTDTEKLVSFAKQKYSEGVSTTTLGLGDDFNEDLLIQMSSAGGGAYYYIESPEVLPTILNEELSGLLSLVGQNLSVTITGPHAANMRQMNAYVEDLASGGKTYRLGDLFGDEVKALVLEMLIPSVLTEGRINVASVRIEYDQLSEGGVRHVTMERTIDIDVSREALMPTRQVNHEVTQQVMLLKAAQARRRAVTLADEGKFNEASQILEQASVEIKQSEVSSDDTLREESAALEREAEVLRTTSDAAEGYRQQRKLMQSQAMYTMTSRHSETVVLRKRATEAPTHPPGHTDSLHPPTDSEIEVPPPPTNAQKALPVPKYARYGEHDYPLTSDEIFIGRAVENAIIVNDRGVSRYHCVLRRDGDQIMIEDTGSTNGTMLNGTLLRGRQALHVGDFITLGEARITFHAGVEGGSDTKPLV